MKDRSDTEIAAAAARAMAMWPQIAHDAGLPPEGVSFQTLPVLRSFADQRSVQVVTVEDGRKFVLRAEFSGDNQKKVLADLVQQDIVAKALSDVPGVSAPQFLWRDPDRPIVLMEFAQGEVAFRELRHADLGLVRRDEVWQRIGMAVAKLHEVSHVKPKQFWPKPLLARVSDRAEAVRSGALDMPRSNRFLGLCSYLHRAGRRAKGLPFEGAVEHGDLHLHNIILSEDTVCFIDFSNHRNLYPQRDLANLWVTAVANEQQGQPEAGGFGLIRPGDMAAFERGYGAQLIGDPIYEFFHALRLFNVWRSFGKIGRPNSEKGRRKLDLIVGILDSLIAAERASE